MFLSDIVFVLKLININGFVISNMTKPINNNLSDSRLSEKTASTASISTMTSKDSSGDFKFSEIFEEFRKCNEKHKDDEGKQSYGALVARRTAENNSKSHHTDEWTSKTLEDAGHGRYNGK